MNNSVKLLIALGFAAGAAILNFLWVQQSLPKYKDYTVYAFDMEQSTVIDDNAMLKKISLAERADFKNSDMYIPWNDRGVVIGLKTPRNVKKNELVLNTDVTAKEVPPKFSMLGPFRLLSVGNQFIKKDASSQEQAPSSRGGSVVGRIPVTLIISKQIDSHGAMTYDTKVEQLLHILELDQRSKSRNRETSIMAVLAMSGSPAIPPNEKDDNPLKPNEVAIVIDLPNVPVITDVLLKNPSPEIGFVVPASLIP